MWIRFVALMMFGLSFGAAQTKVASKKPQPQQAIPIPASLKAAAIDVYVVLDDGLTTLNPFVLKVKTDRLKAELLLAEDGAAGSGESESTTKARFADYELAKFLLPQFILERQAYDLLQLQSDSCKKFESVPRFFSECQDRMSNVLDGLTQEYDTAKAALNRTRHPSSR